MKYFLLFSYYIVSILISKAISQKCIENENFCTLCHPLTNLCIKCINEVLIPNDSGGCDGINKCIFGKNFCNKCNEEETLCQECEPGLFPDSNGACAYTQNCILSLRGQCILCESDYVLLEQNNYARCKSLKSDDLKNCKIINNTYGWCEECEDGFYLNEGDKKCIQINNCYESTFGKCDYCIENYYLDKEKNECIEKNNTLFLNCKKTLDGEKCQECEENYFLSKDGICILTNFCKKTEKNEKCAECIEGYHLIKNNVCSLEENCEEADLETGICHLCKNNYFLNNTNRKCISNREDNNYKYCKKFLNKCIECEKNYYLSNNNSICSSTQYCSEAENGNCILCQDNYYLTLNNICTIIKGCIRSGNNEGCNECKDGFYYSFPQRLCIKSENDFLNCRYSTWDQCDSCKDNYYLKKPERICLNNTEEGIFYKCKMTDKNGEYCAECDTGYFLTTGEDKICVKMRGCKVAQNENVCLQCDKGFCFDKNKKMCFDSYNIDNEKNIKYFGCEYTDEEGIECEKCVDGYTLVNGICISKNYCLEEKDGKCVKCEDKKTGSGNNICLNKDFGCIETYANNCFKCDNILDLYSCSECKEGYQKIAGYCL